MSSSKTYEDLYAKLDARSMPPALSPRQPADAALSAAILGSGLSNLLVCGLLIWNEDFQSAHPIAQAIESEDGSYWHGIIHRMEADYWNAKYWFRRAPNHPLLRTLAEHAEAKPYVTGGKWNPAAFIDACERVAGRDLNDQSLRQLQLAEIKTLLALCQAAT